MKQKEADEIFERMMALNRNPNSSYLEIEPAQIKIILNSPVDNYTETLEQKLKNIECGECRKNLLECQCNEREQ